MKILFLFLSFSICLLSFGQDPTAKIATARAYNNTNIVTNNVKAITATKVNSANTKILDAIEALRDSTTGSVQTIKVTVSSAEILALFTTPKTLVAAPGAGKLIVPLAVAYRLNFGTTAYTTNLNLRVKESFTLTQNGGILGLSGLAYSLQPLAGGVLSSDVSNTALTLDVATGNPDAGDGTLDVYISYTVITL